MALMETDEDRANEDAVAGEIETKWDMIIGRYGPQARVDRYAIRESRGKPFTVATFEVKCRTHASTAYTTVYLSLQKYLALLDASDITECPALYVVRFTDRTLYKRIDLMRRDVDYAAPPFEVKGREPRPGAPNDQEPVIDLYIDRMKPVVKR
jgi:hypothetical protein